MSTRLARTARRLALALLVAAPGARPVRAQPAVATSVARAAAAAPRLADAASIGARFETVRVATGVRLRYAVAGDPGAPPVVLLHGLADSWYSFARVLPALARTHRVYALDQRGHGASERPTAGYTMTGMADDVLAFLDALDIPRAALVGHSMGSFVARHVATRAPDRVSRLVLVGSGLRGATAATRTLPALFAPLPDAVPDAFAREWQGSTVYAPVPAEYMERWILECRQVPARVWRSGLDGLLADAPATVDRAPRMPTLLLSGDRDAVFTVADQDSLGRVWPAVHRLRYADVGHAPHWEVPARFAQDVLAFLAR